MLWLVCEGTIKEENVALVYDPTEVKNWSNAVVDYLDGGGVSIKGCTNKFNEQMEKLVQPNIWTGAAAAKNFQNFMETHNALIKFTNEFGGAFSSAMTEVAKNVNDLEVGNLGENTNVSATFGSLSYSQLNEMAVKNINQDAVRYDYTAIVGIGSELARIKTSLTEVRSSLVNKINELDSGREIWDGGAAAAAREELTSVITKNMEEIEKTLDICIKNIATAGEKAQHADQG